jgi:hypothetical protein
MGSDYGIVITSLVMTLAELSATHENTICTSMERLDNKEWIYSSGAHDPYNPDVWWVLKPGYPC